MSRSTTAKNSMATAFASLAATAGLFAADPGSTGAGEISGGSPAYARKALAGLWASSGTGSQQAQVTFDVEAGDAVGGGGVFDASGNFLDGGPLTSFTFTAQGKYVLTVVDTES